MKRYLTNLAIILILLMTISACNRNGEEQAYVKKLELKHETIAVGIYKATGIQYNRIEDITEAINIDGGIVYVTLNDADVLKTHLDNIDVVIFPEMINQEDFKVLDDEIADVFKNFITTKGKGAIGIANGIDLLVNNDKCKSLELVELNHCDSSIECHNGLVEFKLTELGESIFPELKNQNHIFIHCQNYIGVSLKENTDESCQLVGIKAGQENAVPFFITSKNGNGNIFLSLVHPESTPGMRWIIPRIIRYVNGKELIQYNKNVFRPELYQDEMIFNDAFNLKNDSLINTLETGNKQEKLDALDELQKLYPWYAAEKVKALLLEKSDDIKLRAAQFLLDAEYTSAIKDIKEAAKKERRRKVREKLKEFQKQMEAMLDQN